MNSDELKRRAEEFCDACANEPENWDRRGTVEALVEFAESLMPDYESLVEQALISRLSPPGQCVYCGGNVAKIKCDKCGWIDPPTKNAVRGETTE